MDDASGRGKSRRTDIDAHWFAVCVAAHRVHEGRTLRRALGVDVLARRAGVPVHVVRRAIARQRIGRAHMAGLCRAIGFDPSEFEISGGAR